MNIRKLSGIACLSLVALGFTACGDDYEQMYLVSSDDETVVFGETGDTLSLFAYGESVSLTIQGGEGYYVIDNSDDTVATYQYNGKTLTVSPISVGTTVITITDTTGSVYELTVEVNYVEETFNVVSQTASVTGELMTLGEMKEVISDITNNMSVSVGGSYRFVYHDKDCTEGIITIYPAESQSNSYYGNFSLKNLFTPEGQEYRYTTVNIGSGTYTFSLIKDSSGNVTELHYDVTEQYQTAYPELESAYAIQGLEQKTSE